MSASSEDMCVNEKGSHDFSRPNEILYDPPTAPHLTKQPTVSSAPTVWLSEYAPYSRTSSPFPRIEEETRIRGKVEASRYGDVYVPCLGYVGLPDLTEDSASKSSVDSGYGSTNSTFSLSRSGKSVAAPRKLAPAVSPKPGGESIRPANRDGRDRPCSRCGYKLSSQNLSCRHSFNRPLRSTTERKTLHHVDQALSTTETIAPPIHSLVPQPSWNSSPSISNVIFGGPSDVVECGEAPDLQPSSRNKEESTEQRMNLRASFHAIAPRRLPGNDLASKLAQGEQPSYIKNWVDSPYATQSSSLECNRETMASRALNGGIGYGTTRATSESEEGTIDTDSESFAWTEYSEDWPEWDPSGATLTPMKIEYIFRLLYSFDPFRKQWQSPATADQMSHHSPRSRNGKHQASSSPSGDSSQKRPSKRTKRQSANYGGDGTGQGYDDDGNDDSQNTPPNIAEDGQEPCRLFACPFVKRYPGRYHKCYSRILRDVGRVKFHLFRDKAHRLPIYCPNCSEIFSNEDIRDEHVRDAKCTKKPQVKWEGITATQRTQLNKRSPATNSAVENWNTLYKILFPGEPLPSSPYNDISLSAELLAFREHVLSEGPSIWNEILHTRLPENLRPFSEELQAFHQSFYSDAVTRLFESWGSRYSTPPSFQSQRSSSPTRQETEPPFNPNSTAAVMGSNSPPRSASGPSPLGTDDNQSENGPGSGSRSGDITSYTQEQQSAMQGLSQSVFPRRQTQTFPHFAPETAPIISPHNRGRAPLHPQYHSPGSTSQTEHGSPQWLYPSSQAATLFSPGLGQSSYTQDFFDPSQPYPEIWPSPYQPQPVGFYQMHQVHTEPQFPYDNSVYTGPGS